MPRLSKINLKTLKKKSGASSSKERAQENDRILSNGAEIVVCHIGRKSEKVYTALLISTER